MLFEIIFLIMFVIATIAYFYVVNQVEELEDKNAELEKQLDFYRKAYSNLYSKEFKNIL